MSVFITDAGFGPDTLPARCASLDIGPDASPEDLAAQLPGLDMIRIEFPSFADGRGFTIARRLRRLGYAGHLRAHGHILADQYTMARRAGFDDVEIDDDLATRQPQDQWQARADWRAHDYQSRLKGQPQT